MNFESGETSKAEISLCIFPHLSELIVVDARSDLPGRPRFDTLRVGDIFDEEFFGGLEKEFSSLLRRDEPPFLKLLALPQELERKIRLHGLRALLTTLDADLRLDEVESAPNVAVLFLTGPFLTLDEDGLRRALNDLFDGQLQGEGLKECVSAVVTLAASEREASDGSSTGELTRLIRGDSSHYATLWQNEE